MAAKTRAARAARRHPTTTRLRAVLYIRVSSEDQAKDDRFSLDNQTASGKRLIEQRGWDLAHVYADEGKSAFTDDITKRPEFQRMIQDAALDAFDVIVVWKLDRFARHSGFQALILAQLDLLGVQISSVTEGDIDISSPAGFLQTGFMGLLNDYFSRNLGSNVSAALQEKKRQGQWTGPVPWGTMLSVSKTLLPHPQRIGGVTLAMERYAEGAQFRDISLALFARGYRPYRCERFNTSVLYLMLRNRAYIGDMPLGARGCDGWMTGAHESMVAPALWEAVQREAAGRTLHARRFTAPAASCTHAFSGLLRCTCGANVRVVQNGTWGSYFRCAAAATTDLCQGISIKETRLEAQIGEKLKALKFPDDLEARVLALYTAARPAVADADQAVARLEGRRERLVELRLSGDITKEDFEARKVAIAAELARLERPPAEKHGQASGLATLGAVLRTAGQGWEAGSPQARQNLLRLLFEDLTVDPAGVLVEWTPAADFAPLFGVASELADQTFIRSTRADGVLTYDECFGRAFRLAS